MLVDYVANRVYKDIFDLERDKNWKILVLDSMTTKILSQSTKMSELLKEKIVIIEDLNKKRRPMPELDAIYFITPTRMSLTLVIDDFVAKDQYKSNRVFVRTHTYDQLGIHLYLTDRLPDDLFSLLGNSRASKKIAALREIDVAFMPFESRVFLLDEPRFYKRIVEDSYRQRKLERLAEQLNTVAIALGGDFNMFFQSQISNCVDLASLTRKKLNQNGRLSSTIGDLIIVDRSYDPFAPLLHELTYQAMTYDVLRADGDIVTIDNRQLLLDETEDKTWASLRHMHMADVMKKLANKYEDLNAKQKGLNKIDGTTKSLAELMRRLPHFQKQIQELERHISISEELDKNYDSWIDDLCDAEQDLACDSTTKPVKAVIPWILNKDLSDEMKMRLILLLCHNKKGIEEEKLLQLLKNSGIKEDKWKVVKNMRFFNATVINNDLPIVTKMPKRKQNEDDIKFTDSRYVSRITDLIHYCHAGELDERIFTKIPSVKPKMSSVKSGNEKRKTVVFILGGVAPSEMRAAYELSNQTFKPSSSWFSSKNPCNFTSDVYIGSSHIAMPHTQLHMFSDI